MIILKGKHNEALVYTDNVDNATMSQVVELCNQSFTEGSIIRIMPDTHAGAGCVIGTTMTITDKVVPSIVGVDIGCGIHTAKLMAKEMDFKMLDAVINSKVPSGFDIRNKPHEYNKLINLEELICAKHVDLNRAELSICTLGGGNHFIEVDKDENDNLYIVVHTGSRHLGKQVAEYYQDKAYKRHISVADQVKEVVEKLKSEGKQHEIEARIKELQPEKIQKSLAYLFGSDFDDYIHDMKIVQRFAQLNRRAIISEILHGLNIYATSYIVDYEFETIHNYIDMQTMILRKGAVSAIAGEQLLIPINMRDGSLLCVGKGNPDWNYSAPHGAGRLMSRSQAKESISLEEFIKSMTGIYTTSIGNATIDESPMAYKPMEEIMENIRDTVDIISIIKPVYNFKAGGD